MAEELGITQGAVSQYLNGRIPMNYRTLKTFCLALGVEDTDIRSDLPEQQFNTPSPPSDEYAEVLALSEAVGLPTGPQADEYAQANAMKFRKSALRRKGILAKPLAIFYARDGSMEPFISNGDSVLLDTSDTAAVDGGIYVVSWLDDRHQAYGVRRAMTLEGEVFFASDNPTVSGSWQKPRRMESKQEPIAVAGRVHWIGGWAD
jgi:phage repressor protein C with HTH and peptisase S24 domain